MSLNYNVRGTVGKRKGKFIKANIKEFIDGFLKRTDGKQGRKVKVSFYVS